MGVYKPISVAVCAPPPKKKAKAGQRPGVGKIRKVSAPLDHIVLAPAKKKIPELVFIYPPEPEHFILCKSSSLL